MFFFFFYFDEKLKDNIIVQEAFYNQCFRKIIDSGYCDMNSYFGKPAIKKETIVYNLELKKSPLVSLFREVDVRNLEDATDKLQQVLNEMVINKIKIDDYCEFAIIYYIYKSIPSNEDKEEFTRNILEAWKDSQYEKSDITIDDMELRISNGIIFDNKVIDLHIINTMNQYMSLLEKVAEKNEKLFFRGHSDISYKLIPSVFRSKDWLENEKLMYQELKINCATEFGVMKGHIEVLAEMQHYGLPTRLLDITKNPLVALYFSCEAGNSHSGEVIILGIKKELIKYPQSDTAAVLASLPLFTYDEQKQFYNLSKNYSNDMEKFNNRIERLIQEVRIERPGFIGKIRPEDLRKSVVIVPTRNNRRLEKQEGAFVVCGLLDEVYGKIQRNSLDDLRVKSKEGKKIVCIINDKVRLLKQLNSLGINKSKIYPEIDDVADYIKNNVTML